MINEHIKGVTENGRLLKIRITSHYFALSSSPQRPSLSLLFNVITITTASLLITIIINCTLILTVVPNFSHNSSSYSLVS